MALGLPAKHERPTQMTWDETAKTARLIVDWARDAALLPYATATPPDRNDPDSTWRLQIKAELAAELGGGWVWVPVGKGDIITFSGTEEDPVFSVRSPRRAARTLDGA